MFGFRKRRQRNISNILIVTKGKKLTSNAINDEIEKRFGKKNRIWTGCMYPILEELEEEDLITSEWVPGTYPRKRVYTGVEMY